ncbi:mycothiol system anti-sigma-R factor [Jonesiaceae bacterium BS-20]|uniref:Mycothiol system anti-sigma-R factor n=1 Tax=Jonesiaceae bacterium BS-20 TaxID=3120821 RepID=A0AAU7DVL0_9MICO
MKPNGLESEQPAPNATDCENIAAHIFEYLDSEMTPVDAERMRAHVAECNPCLGELSIDEMIKRVLKRSCSEQAPEHLRVRIKAQFTSVRYEF